MNFADFLLKHLNRCLNFLSLLLFLLLAAYSLYALWDNQRIYDSAGEVQESLLQWKPAVSESGEVMDNSADFSRLKAINPDVWGWLEMEHTGIDYPVVQGETNLSYISRDIYGEYALAGSIFLDARNNRDPQDAYLLVYGHDVEKHRMFGDLALYRDARFFSENRSGTLILEERTWKLRTVACLQAPEGERRIFDPELVNDDLDIMLDYVYQHAEQIDEIMLQYVRKSEDAHFLALTTCSEDFTDSRTIVLTVME